jgi:hypothetical protein
VLLRWPGLLYSVVDNEVQKEIITTQHAADFSAALQMDEQLFVHELEFRSVNCTANESDDDDNTFFNSGWDAFDMVAGWTTIETPVGHQKIHVTLFVTATITGSILT